LTAPTQVSDSVRASRSGDANEKKEIDMRRKLTWVALFSAVIMVTALYTGNALATPAIGFVGTTVGLGRFGEVDVYNQLIPRDGPGAVWLSWQKSIGLSDVYVQNNVWDPGGTTGWHTHPGHSLIIVTAGTVTAYEGKDPGCKPAVYTTGMGFVDPGGDHVHIIRNEGSVEARTIAVQLIPADAVRRIDADNPGNCPF
jgi:hypothetical protein